MNLLIYFGNQLNPQRGGTERVACLLADYLSARGHRLFYMACTPVEDVLSRESVFLPAGTEDPSPENVAFVRHFIAENRIDLIINEGGNTDSVYLFSHGSLPEVRIITHLHFDVRGGIDAFYKTLWLPLRGVGVRDFVVHLLKRIKAPWNRYRALKEKRARFRYMYDHSDGVVVLAPEQVEKFCSLTGREPAGKVFAIVNPNTFRIPCDPMPPKENRLLFVGRLDYASKRVDRVLKVWRIVHKTHPDWWLTLVGSGPDENRLRALAAKWRLPRVEFAGYVDPSPCYRSAKILLLTSNFEGTPMVIPEAMAHGVVPVVMDTFVGSHVHIRNGENGMLSRPFDIADMARKVEKLIENTELWNAMSERAVRHIASMKHEELFEPWNDLIHE